MKIINAKEEVDQNDSNFNFSKYYRLQFKYVEGYIGTKFKIKEFMHIINIIYTPHNFMAFAKQKAPEREASKCAILYGIRKHNYTGVFLRFFPQN